PRDVLASRRDYAARRKTQQKERRAQGARQVGLAYREEKAGVRSLHRSGGSGFLRHRGHFRLGFLDGRGGVFRKVLAGGEHQLDSFHLGLLRDFGEGGEVFSGHLGGGSGEVRNGLRVVRRLFLDLRQRADLGQRFLGPFRRDLARLLGGLEGDLRDLLAKRGRALERVLEGFLVERELRSHVLHDLGEILSSL